MSRIYDAMRRAERDQEKTLLHTGTGRGRPAPPVDRAHEAQRRLAQRLLARPDEERPKVVLVASAVHGEGASTVARDLATTLARSTADGVALVDANLRTPSQHLACGVDRGPGLADIAAGSATFEPGLLQTVDGAVSLLSCGNATGSPAGAGDLAMRDLFGKLRASFGWVVVDAPPVCVYADAAALSDVADGAVLVLKAERTRWEVAHEAKQALEDAGLSVLGAVLNRRRYHIPAAIYRLL